MHRGRGRDIDAAVANQLLEAVSGQAVQAALLAGQQTANAQETVRLAVERELEEARYAAELVRTPPSACRSRQTTCRPDTGSPLERRVGAGGRSRAEARKPCNRDQVETWDRSRSSDAACLGSSVRLERGRHRCPREAAAGQSADRGSLDRHRREDERISLGVPLMTRILRFAIPKPRFATSRP